MYKRQVHQYENAVAAMLAAELFFEKYFAGKKNVLTAPFTGSAPQESLMVFLSLIHISDDVQPFCRVDTDCTVAWGRV